jgi:hypothetical protein
MDPFHLGASQPDICTLTPRLVFSSEPQLLVFYMYVEVFISNLEGIELGQPLSRQHLILSLYFLVAGFLRLMILSVNQSD